MQYALPMGECLRPSTCGVLGPADLCPHCLTVFQRAEFQRLTPHFQHWIHLHKRFPWLGRFTGYPIKVSHPPFPKVSREEAFQLIGAMADAEVRSTFLGALLVELMPLMRQVIRKELAQYHAATQAEPRQLEAKPRPSARREIDPPQQPTPPAVASLGSPP